MKKAKRKGKAKTVVRRAAQATARRAKSTDVYTVVNRSGLYYLHNTTRKEQPLGPFSTLAKANEFAKTVSGRASKKLRILG